MAPRKVELPRVLEAAEDADVMQEQFEFLLRCGSEHLACYCSECQRYREVKAILLERFGEPTTWRTIPKAA